MLSSVRLVAQARFDFEPSFVNQIALPLTAVHVLAVSESKNVAYFQFIEQFARIL